MSLICTLPMTLCVAFLCDTMPRGLYLHLYFYRKAAKKNETNPMQGFFLVYFFFLADETFLEGNV